MSAALLGVERLDHPALAVVDGLGSAAVRAGDDEVADMDLDVADLDRLLPHLPRLDRSRLGELVHAP